MVRPERINSLAFGRWNNLKMCNFWTHVQFKFMRTCEIALRWMPQEVISQHWFMWWLGAVRQQAITWANFLTLGISGPQWVNNDCNHSGGVNTIPSRHEPVLLKCYNTYLGQFQQDQYVKSQFPKCWNILLCYTRPSECLNSLMEIWSKVWNDLQTKG